MSFLVIDTAQGNQTRVVAEQPKEQKGLVVLPTTQVQGGLGSLQKRVSSFLARPDIRTKVAALTPAKGARPRPPGVVRSKAPVSVVVPVIRAKPAERRGKAPVPAGKRLVVRRVPGAARAAMQKRERDARTLRQVRQQARRQRARVLRAARTTVRRAPRAAAKLVRKAVSRRVRRETTKIRNAARKRLRRAGRGLEKRAGRFLRGLFG